MLYRNEYPTVERVDRLEEGARCDSIGPHNEFWFISVIENAAFSLLSGLQSPGPGRGVRFAAFVFLKVPPLHPPPFYFCPSIYYCLTKRNQACFALLRSYWNIDERYGKG